MEIPQVEKGYSPLDFGEVLECSLRYWFKGLPRYLLMYLSLNLVTVAAVYGLIFLSGANPWVIYVASLLIPGILRILLPLPPLDSVTVMFLAVLAAIFLVYIILGLFVSATVVKHAADRHEGLDPELKACFSHAWSCKLQLIGSFLLVTLFTTAIGVGGVSLLVGLMFYLFFSLWLWSPLSSLSPLVILGAMFGVFIAIILLLILLLYISIRLSVYIPAVVLDGAGAVESLRTSWRIVKGHFWRTFAIVLIIGLITGVIVTPVALLSSRLLFVIPLPPFILISTVIHIVVISIAAPLTPVTQTMIYHDLMGRCYGA